MTDNSRIMKLEEAVAFNERTIDELSAELAKAYERLDALSKTIEDLGTRLTDLEFVDAAPDDDDDEAHPPIDPALERPPHSTGPRN